MNASNLLLNLLKDKTCPSKNSLPQSVKEWSNFIDIAYRNRLISLLYHFVSCKKCSPLTPQIIQNSIRYIYTETLIRYKNYQKIKNKIKKFMQQNKTQLILIKDFDKIYEKYYPSYYIPQKFDIDLFGKYEDFKKIKEFIGNNGYNPHGQLFMWPKYLKRVYKFNPIKKDSFLPQIDFRYYALITPRFKLNIIEKNAVDKLTEELWQNISLNPNRFAQLSSEYLYIYSCLIYYFEDFCKGLNNLYRLFVIADYYKNEISWNKIQCIGKKYKILNILLFSKSLVEREFSTKGLTLSMPYSIKIALRLVNQNYVYKVPLATEKKIYQNRNYRRIPRVPRITRVLLTEMSIWRKILYFLYPKLILFPF